MTTKLQPQLNFLEKSLTEVENDIGEYVELGHILESLLARNNPSGPIEAKVENPKGSGNYISAIIHDTSTIYVDLGQSQPTKLPLEDAEKAVKLYVQNLEKKKEGIVQDLDKLNKDIFTGMATIHQLQQLEESNIAKITKK